MVTVPTAERIAREALAILVREGAEAVTMRRVAAAAGVTPMATYKHYPNRETLLRTVADVGFAEVAKDWGQRARGGDWLDRAATQLHDVLDFALGSPHLYTFLLTDQREQARRFPDDFRTGESPIFTPLLIAVEAGMREGAVRRDDAVEVAMALASATQGLIQMYLGGRIGLSETDFRALCERTARRIFDGLKA